MQSRAAFLSARLRVVFCVSRRNVLNECAEVTKLVGLAWLIKEYTNVGGYTILSRKLEQLLQSRPHTHLYTSLSAGLKACFQRGTSVIAVFPLQKVDSASSSLTLGDRSLARTLDCILLIKPPQSHSGGP